MKYNFLLRDRIESSESIPLNPRETQIAGYNIHVFDGWSLYFSNDEKRIKKKKVGELNEYWLVHEGLAICLTRKESDEEMRRMIESYSNFGCAVGDTLEKVRNPEKYAEDAQAAKEKRDAERIERDREIAERDEKRKQAHEEAVRQAAIDFQNGKMIDAEYFEELCKRNGVQMHMRTVGSLRKNIVEICNGRARHSAKNGVSTGIWVAAQELFNVLS
jgi:hypothetical protein